MSNPQLHYATTIDHIAPGKMRRFVLANQAIIICNVDGDFYAVDDMCTHEDASLYLGCLKKDEIQCSLHGGRFNVKTGLATEEPAEVALKTYPVSVQDQSLYVTL